MIQPPARFVKSRPNVIPEKIKFKRKDFSSCGAHFDQASVIAADEPLCEIPSAIRKATPKVKLSLIEKGKTRFIKARILKNGFERKLQKTKISGKKSRHRRSRSFSRRRSRSSSYESGSRHRLKDRDSIYESRASFRDRENPRASNVLGVFNLGRDFPECELRRLFQKYGRIKACNLVYDKKYRESRGFGFVTFANIDDAIYAQKRRGRVGHIKRATFSETYPD
ncbi:unnamed protein product [Oikopleura dioica]|uniref:RRM domain-containing protein n=1 Tax=Oikopleura dioica TaxID=34765 RepID=E4YUP5_OIKDI|nr:unnamed protein product [Oikopleura dioica]